MDSVELVAEFVGTLIYTYAITTSNNQPYAVAGCLYIAMAFTGYASTPQFNPAVTFAMALRRIFHGEFGGRLFIKFTANIVVQILSATLAGLMGWGTEHHPFAFTVHDGFNHYEAFLAEMAYTAAICATCLTAKRVTESLVISGGAIAIAYLTGILSVSNISSACFNPAAAIGLNLIHYIKNGTKINDTWIYVIAPLVGSVIGTAIAAIFINIENEKITDSRTKSLEGLIAK